MSSSVVCLIVEALRFAFGAPVVSTNQISAQSTKRSVLLPVGVVGLSHQTTSVLFMELQDGSRLLMT